MYNTKTTKYTVDGFRCGDCPASKIIRTEYGGFVNNDTVVTAVVTSPGGVTNKHKITVGQLVWPFAVYHWMIERGGDDILVRVHDPANDRGYLTQLSVEDGKVWWFDGFFRSKISLSSLSKDKQEEIVGYLRRLGFNESKYIKLIEG